METIQLIMLAGILVLLYFCSIVLSVERTRAVAHSIYTTLESHAAGLQGYRNAWREIQTASRQALAMEEAARKDSEEARRRQEYAIACIKPGASRRSPIQ